MKRIVWVIFLVSALFCASAFLGCASVPKEELDAKEAVIQNLNNQIATLNAELNRLREENKELTSLRSELERQLKEKERLQKQAVEEKAAPKIK